MTPCDYLENTFKWRAVSSRGANIYGPCPFHQGFTLKHGQKADFVIYPPERSKYNDWHYKCYSSGCEASGDFTRLVWKLEYPTIGEDDKKAWATQIFPRMQELGEAATPRRHFTFQQREEKPEASSEQKAIMTVALDWWHFVLSETVAGKPGRTWLQEQDISPTLLSLGYAPRMNTALFESFDESISQALGTPNWYELGVQTGLLREDGTIRLQERIIFACTNDEDTVLFYQARTIKEGMKRAKFLNPPLRKEPFFLPISTPRIKGFCLVESPKGPSAFAYDSIPMGATLGSGVNAHMLQTLVKRFGEPVYITTDNDPPEIDPESGEVTPGPGEKLAQKAIALCTQAGYEWYRILPPQQYKDPDTWRRHEGSMPLLREIERVKIR